MKNNTILEGDIPSVYIGVEHPVFRSTLGHEVHPIM